MSSPPKAKLVSFGALILGCISKGSFACQRSEQTLDSQHETPNSHYNSHSGIRHGQWVCVHA